MFGVKDSYRPGDPLASIRMRDLSLMAAFLNYLSVGKYFNFTKPDEPTQDTPPCIELNIEELAADLPGKDNLTHEDITDWDYATAEFAKQEDVDELTDDLSDLTDAVQGIADDVDAILADYATGTEVEEIAESLSEIADVVNDLNDAVTDIAAAVDEISADMIDVAQEVIAIDEDLDDLVAWYNTGVISSSFEVGGRIEWDGTKVTQPYWTVNVANGLITSVGGTSTVTINTVTYNPQ